MTKKLSGKDFDGTGRCLSEVLSKNLPEGIEKNHESSQYKRYATPDPNRKFLEYKCAANSHANLFTVSNFAV
jgi:hypothetical protein